MKAVIGWEALPFISSPGEAFRRSKALKTFSVTQKKSRPDIRAREPNHCAKLYIGIAYKQIRVRMTGE